MFTPNFKYSDKLVSNIGKVRELLGNLNSKSFSSTVLVELYKDARELSSYSSTSIEGNPLPLTDVKKILKNKPANVRDSEREVLNYNKTLIYLNKLIASEKEINLSNDLVCLIQKMVTENLLPEYESGKYRDKPVFVNDPKLRQTIYWPPDHKDIISLMEELIEYINRNKGVLDPMILGGIFHKQFVVIHPFIDGNGRTSRLVTKVILASLGLNTFQLFSFENYYNNNITKYFENVGVKGNYYDEINNLDFTTWLEYFTDGIIDELNRVNKILSRPNTLEERLEPHHLKILELIKENNLVTDSDYAKVTNRSKASRALDFQKLLLLNYIERKGAARSTYYILKQK